MEKLYKLIREENVVLFIGAGFSLYTGLPSGNKLKEELINSVPDLKDDLNYNDSLNKVADDIINLQNGSRNSTNKLLRKLFNKTNFENLETHQKLASIPHISSIITTNYDKTLEIAYSDNHHLIYKDEDLAYIEKSKINIYKIHGTIDDLDSIILSKKDYNDLYKNNFSNSLIWSQIKSLLTTKTVIYIGYGHEDDNIDVITDFIHDSIGSNFKEAYLISPNLKRTKLAELDRKKINYIDSTGEEFINGLLENIRENILKDFENQLVSYDTYNKFLENENLKSTITSINNKNIIKKVEPTNKQITANIHFQLYKESTKNQDLEKFAKGEHFGEIQLNKSDLQYFNSKIGNLTRLNYSDFQWLKIMHVPLEKGVIDIYLKDKFSYKNIQYEIFNSQTRTEFRLKFNNNSIITITLTDKKNSDEFKTSFNFNQSINTVENEYNFYRFLNKILIKKVPFKVYHKNNEVYNNDLSLVPFNNELKEHCISMYKYFKSLYKIEKDYFCKFIISTINQDDFYKINTINKKKADYLLTTDEEIIFKDEISNKVIDKVDHNNFAILMKPNELITQSIELHNLKFHLECNKIEYYNVDTSSLISELKLKLRKGEKYTYIYNNIRLE